MDTNPVSPTHAPVQSIADSGEVQRLRQAFNEQATHLDILTSRLHDVLSRESELRAQLAELQAALAQRDHEIHQLNQEIQARGHVMIDQRAKLDAIRRSPLGLGYRAVRKLKRILAR